MSLLRYAIGGNEDAWAAAEAKVAAGAEKTVLSVANPNSTKKKRSADDAAAKETSSKKDKSSKKHKHDKGKRH